MDWLGLVGVALTSGLSRRQMMAGAGVTETSGWNGFFILVPGDTVLPGVSLSPRGFLSSGAFAPGLGLS